MNKYPIVVIGAGAGGLVVAISAAKAGKKVLLIEKGHWGGDCTNFGCIPSKSLIAAAEQAHYLKMNDTLGLAFTTPKLETEKVLERVRNIVAKIRSHEDPDALGKLGVDTRTGVATFISAHELKVGDEAIYADKIVLACGSHPFIPPIPGLDQLPYLTNETIFDLKDIPESIGILGAGPIGCELAQAFARLGSKVTLIESMRGIMPQEDASVGPAMRKIFQNEGIDLYLHCDTNQISHENGKFQVCITEDGQHHDVEFQELLISTGRRPNLKELHLDAAKVTHTDRSIPIDAYGRTNQKHIFAIGDVVGGPQFTHLAENQGRSVLTSLLLPWPFLSKFSDQALPRCTYTDPEVASIGLTEDEAVKTYGKGAVATYTVPLEEVDRAITSSQLEGFVKVITKKWSSKILGAVIVAPRAGEMLSELSLAMYNHIPLRKLAKLIHPYPVYNAGIRKAADLWLTQTLLGALKKK